MKNDMVQFLMNWPMSKQ